MRTHGFVACTPRLAAIARAAAAIFVAASLVVIGPPSARAGIVDGCMQDVAGLGTLNCTAEDVTITSVHVLQVIDGCSGIGDTAQLQLSSDIEVNATTRYDVGFYLALDGGDALTGSCFREYFPPPLSNAPTDADLATGYGPYLNATGDNDQCGDGNQNDVTINPIKRLFSDSVVPSQPATITLTCKDDNHDGLLDVTYCSAWRNSSNFTCNSISDSGLPETKAKCKCATIDTIPGVPVPTPTPTPTPT
ncbi:MAG TPA: hypothetical protein VFD92_13085, partial [Candidatus Binatia bacterium]|nr:hypothetical protein [Candidatus Binatia bacterium]